APGGPVGGIEVEGVAQGVAGKQSQGRIFAGQPGVEDTLGIAGGLLAHQAVAVHQDSPPSPAPEGGGGGASGDTGADDDASSAVAIRIESQLPAGGRGAVAQYR